MEEAHRRSRRKPYLAPAAGADVPAAAASHRRDRRTRPPAKAASVRRPVPGKTAV